MAGQQLRAADFGDRWPFTASEAWLECEKGAVTIRVGGVTYALNDVARSVAGDRGWSDTDLLWKHQVEFLKVRFGSHDALVPVPRASVFALIGAGLELCAEESKALPSGER